MMEDTPSGLSENNSGIKPPSDPLDEAPLAVVVFGLAGVAPVGIPSVSSSSLGSAVSTFGGATAGRLTDGDGAGAGAGTAALGAGDSDRSAI